MENIPLDELTQKVGGRFRLVSLFQKRMRELQRGMPPLVKINSSDPMEIGVAEVMAGKIDLLTGEAAEKARMEMAARELEMAEEESKTSSSAVPAPLQTQGEAARRS